MKFLANLDWSKVTKSRTVWLKVVVATLVLLEQNTTQLRGFLPDDTYKIVALALPFLNLWLRMTTTNSLALEPSSEASPTNDKL